MTKLGRPDRRRVSELVYYCEKHGLLNKTAISRDKTNELTKRPQWLETE
jgi:hypothetical protein